MSAPTDFSPPGLAAADLCRICDPQGLPFETTDELEDLAQILDQDRAVEALRFGVGIEHAGDPDALRVALEAGGGILVLAGANDAVVGDTLRELLGQEWR